MSALIVYIIAASALVLVVAIILAPLDALSWWAGRVDDETPGGQALPVHDEAEPAPGRQPDCYVVFLSGIGSISGDELLPREADFLDRLGAALPDAKVISDVFPYAASGHQLLTGQRFFTWLWRRVRRWRSSGTWLLPSLLQLRNMFQVMVSADNRYGPLYSYGLFRLILGRLTAAGFRPGAGPPVVLLGSSGGAQIAVGAATYLKAAIDAPLYIVTVGGVMASERGLARTDHLTSLIGSKDGVYRFGQIVFPGRWPVSLRSEWNQALRADTIEERVIGEMNHAGEQGYLGMARSRDSADAFIDITVSAVRDVVQRDMAGRDRSGVS